MVEKVFVELLVGELLVVVVLFYVDGLLVLVMYVFEWFVKCL